MTAPARAPAWAPAPRVAPAAGPGQGAESPGVLLLSLVHPDMLPSMYAIAEVMRDAGYAVDVFSLASPAPGRTELGPGVRMHECGSLGEGYGQRRRARRVYRERVSAWLGEQAAPRAIVAVCPFTYLMALELAGRRIPVAYHLYELYEVSWGSFRRAAATTLRNWRAMRRLKEAAFLSTPSAERSGWLAGKMGLPQLPATILNAPYAPARPHAERNAEVFERLLPPHFRNATLVVSTGNVARGQLVTEVVESVAGWPDDACLVVTNVGETPYAREVRRAAAASPRARDIALLPLISRADMLDIQAAASVGMALLLEGDAPETMMPAPNKIGEYLNAGLVVAGLRGAYMDRLEQQGVAVLADRPTPECIGAAVRQALARATSPEARERVREAVESWYRMEVQARPLLAFLAGVGDRQSAAVRG